MSVTTTIDSRTITRCQHCGEWTNYALDPQHKARESNRREMERQFDRIKAQCVPRTAAVPPRATQWVKFWNDQAGEYRCAWTIQKGMAVEFYAIAPDYRPNSDVAFALPIISLGE